MPIDKFEGKIATKSRTQVRDEWLASYRLRKPSADTGPKSFPFVMASSTADLAMSHYANAEVLGDATSTTTARGKALEAEAEAAGRPRKRATGALGWITVSTSLGGSNVVAGDLLKFKPTGKKYKALITQAVSDGQAIIVQCVDTGPATNVKAGSELEWLSPRPGMSSTAVVFENADGTGITGGSNDETDEELQLALTQLRRYPAAAGNENEVVQFVESIAGLAIQKAFVVPAVLGPGTKCVLFTMRPATSGDSRLPSSAVIALVESMLKDKFPYDDGIFVATLTEQAIAVSLGVTWKQNAKGWVDLSPWPAWISPAVSVQASPAPTATSCRLLTTVDTTTPAINQSIGFYDPNAKAFVRKVISTVTVVTPNRAWDLVFSNSSPLSDKAFVPVAGQVASAWSDSLQDLVAPVLEYFDRQGPGELYASFSDPGRRQRRVPEPTPDVWPSRIENRLLQGVFAVADDAEVNAPAVPLSTPVGTPPAIAYVHRCTDIAAHRQT